VLTESYPYSYFTLGTHRKLPIQLGFIEGRPGSLYPDTIKTEPYRSQQDTYHISYRFSKLFFAGLMRINETERKGRAWSRKGGDELFDPIGQESWEFEKHARTILSRYETLPL
jgi:hypothetical protein